MYRRDALSLLAIPSAAPAASDEAIAVTLKGLPDRALGVVWGVDTSYGRALIEMLRSTGDRTVGIEENDGIEPLLDLVLARYGGNDGP